MQQQKTHIQFSFEDYKRLAQDKSISKFERIGFPDSYRDGHEEAIFTDICTKLTPLTAHHKTIIDIGPGSSDLPHMLIALCRSNHHTLHLIDSAEMLQHLPDEAFIHKHAALFPHCNDFVAAMQGTCDAILCYSVLQCAFIDVALYRFIDTALSLLAPGGQFLMGDIPNISKRKRFFASETGVRFHQQFMNTKERPTVDFNCIEPDQIDDAVIISILQRARASGFEAYLVPQNPILPMANRREDILIVRS